MFNDKTTESSEKILRDVNMLMSFLNRDDIRELFDASEERKSNGELTKEATAAREKYVKECAKSFETFYYRYTTLFYSIIDNPKTFDMDKLLKFLKLKNRVEITKDITHKQASEQIGAEQYDKYVKPYVDETKEKTF